MIKIRFLLKAALMLVAIIASVSLLFPSQSASAQTGTCSVVAIATLTNNVPQTRTARLRVIDTADNGRIVYNSEVIFQRNETKTIEFSGPVLDTYMIMLNRAGMRLVSFDPVFTGDPLICDEVVVFIGDGRINDGRNQRAAPLAGYCDGVGGIDIYDIDSRGEGTLAFDVTARQITQALAAAQASGQNQLIEEGYSNQLYALTSNELQLNGLVDNNADAGSKLYTFIVPGDTCSVR